MVGCEAFNFFVVPALLRTLYPATPPFVNLHFQFSTRYRRDCHFGRSHPRFGSPPAILAVPILNNF
jgi:hypothetical protein